MTSFSFTARSPDDLTKEDNYTITGEALTEALQYSDTSGLPQLINWLTDLQEKSHGRKRNEGWRLSVGAGSQDVLYKVWDIDYTFVHASKNVQGFYSLLNDGDPVLIESPVYALVFCFS